VIGGRKRKTFLYGVVRVVFMSNTTDSKELAKEKQSGIVGKAKAKITAFLMLLVSMAFMAAPVAAGALNDSISPILEDVATIFTPLLSLIIAAVPLIIAVAVIGFVMGIFKAILDKIGMG